MSPSPRRLAPSDHHMHRLRNRALTRVLRSVLLVQRSTAQSARLRSHRGHSLWPDPERYGGTPRGGRPPLRLVKTSRA